ncbi:MAG: dTDP-4-dehydrorhamnose 3,5-epimerase [Alphaproteobacteria bacterium]|nr:dTDP-4-dehydrorhamnose 3,5-epimerase [Alphaproteobacteria bacterium]
MEVLDTPLPDLKQIRLKVINDTRGFFVERFHEQKFAALGLPTHFAQDNHSHSHPRVLRGLHAQHTPPQGKLVGVLHGRIWDVAVDVRPHSVTFGQHYAAELSAENGLLLWIPPGFAHGFCVLGETPADMLYKVTAPYQPGGEAGIRFDDPALAIPWPVVDPILSDRDRALPGWEEYRANPPAWR